MKKIDMSIVNEETLTKLGLNDNNKKWFLRNIGSLPVSKIKDIVGEYKNIVNWLINSYITSTYDDYGNKLSYFDNVLKRTWYLHYDENGNMISKTIDKNYTMSYTYDKRGNMLTHTDNHGYNDTRTYDDKDNLITRCDTEGNRWARTFDEHGNTLTLLNHKTGYMWAATYDKDDNQLTYVDNKGYSCANTYDQRGNRLTRKDVNREETFTYDDNDNILTIKSYKYSYDPDTNPPTRSKASSYSVNKYTYTNDGVTFTMTENGAPILVVKL